MRNILILLCLFSVSPAFADWQPWDWRQHELRKDEAKPMLGLIRCLMKNAREMRGARAGSQQIVVWTAELDEKGPSRAAQILERCTEFEKSKPAYPDREPVVRVKILHSEFLKFLNANNVYRSSTLWRFLSLAADGPRTFCRELQLGAGIAAILGVSASVEAAYCTTTTFKRWLEVGIGIGAGFGIGGGIDIQGGMPDRKGERSLGFVVTKNTHGGCFFGVGNTDVGLDDMTTQGHWMGAEGEMIGYGVGMLGLQTWQIGLSVPVFPLGDSDGSLFYRIFRGDDLGDAFDILYQPSH